MDGWPVDSLIGHILKSDVEWTQRRWTETLEQVKSEGVPNVNDRPSFSLFNFVKAHLITAGVFLLEKKKY